MRKLTFLAAVSGLSLALAGAADAQSVGGFPIREPGARPTGGSQGAQAPSRLQAEVVVSQAKGSPVKTIAEAMKRVQPGGTILVTGGVYNENIQVTKPVAIIGLQDAEGRNAVVRPASSAACVSIKPDTPLAAVSISKMIFEFDHNTLGASPCIDVGGGTVSVRDSYIVPADSGITQRLAYGYEMRPEMLDFLAHPPRDGRAGEAETVRLERYRELHAQPFGASHKGWALVTGGTSMEQVLHSKNVVGGGVLNGPTAGLRVTAGDVTFDGNVVVGVQKAIELRNIDDARIKANIKENHLIANGVGVAAYSPKADLFLAKNTIRYNRDAGVYADVGDNLQILANEISGNGEGVFLSENVRLGTINSNFVVDNFGDALKVSTGFFGAVSGNTFAGNNGCTVDFYSAEQKILNNVSVKLVAWRDFNPALGYAATNRTIDNDDDTHMSKREARKIKFDATRMVPPCGGEL